MTGVGAMIGAGIFILTGIAAGIAGPGLLVAFAFNGVIATIIAMVYAELGSAMPEAGGGYIWAREGLGERQGFLTGWMSWFAAAIAGSLYALGFAAYFMALIGNLGVNIPSGNVFFIEKIDGTNIRVGFDGATEVTIGGRTDNAQLPVSPWYGNFIMASLVALLLLIIIALITTQSLWTQP